MPGPETRHLSILLTDIKGFTDKTSHKTRADIQTMLDEHRAIVLPILENGGGRLIKTIGDAFLMTFESPTNAVLAGVAVQEALAKRNAGRGVDDRLEIRIAINSGEVNLADGDVFGEPVNITARIEGIAEAGQVYFTEAVYLAMNKAEVPSSEIGLMQLKGIPEKIRVYKARREEPVGAAAIAAPERSGFRRFLPPMPAAPAAFGPGVKAIPAAPAALPKSWRRAAALTIDWIVCLIILSFFTGGGRHARASSRPYAPPSVAMGVKGLDVRSGDAKVSMDGKGMRVQSDGGSVAIDAAGVHVESSGADEGDSFARGLLDGKWDFALIWAIYNLLFLKWIGASPGKQLMKLRVVALNGQPLEKKQRMMRALFSLVSGYALLLGYLWALWEPQRRTWHDLVAGTRVVPAE